MKLSVAVICKNEEAVIEKCLKSVQGADEIIVCDTGSTDNTIGIASKYAHVDFGYAWKDDFADARNYALSFCTGDWVLGIDADEELLTSISDIKRQITVAEAEGFNALHANLIWDQSHRHRMVRVFKKELRWEGRVHEHIACHPKVSTIDIKYGKSPSHTVDPDRNIRILLSSLSENPTPRDMFYLASEYFDRRDWNSSLFWYQKYVKVSTWREEKADANLRIARCLFTLQRGDEARDACLQAILGVPEFKEALNFMADMSWEKEATTWRRYAQSATNEGLVFVREDVLYSGSYPSNRAPIMEIIKGLNPKTILEIGTGTGYYGELIRMAMPTVKLTGVEIFERYRNAKWDNYDKVLIKNVVDIPSLSASLVLMVDVLEHFTRDNGLALLNRIKGKILVSVPRNYDQGEVHGNKYQKHLSQWTEEDFPGWEDYSNELSVIMLRR